MCLCATKQVGPRGEEGERKAHRIRDGTCQGDEEGKDKCLIKVLKVEVSVPGHAGVNSFLTLPLTALEIKTILLEACQVAHIHNRSAHSPPRININMQIH